MPIKHLLYGKTHISQVSWCVICDDAGARGLEGPRAARTRGKRLPCRGHQLKGRGMIEAKGRGWRRIMRRELSASLKPEKTPRGPHATPYRCHGLMSWLELLEGLRVRARDTREAPAVPRSSVERPGNKRGKGVGMAVIMGRELT